MGEVRVHLQYVNDDWVRLFISGDLVAEGHSLDERMVAEPICKECEIPFTYEFIEEGE